MINRRLLIDCKFEINCNSRLFWKNSQKKTFFWFWNKLFFFDFLIKYLEQIFDNEIKFRWNWQKSKLYEEKRRFSCRCKSNKLNFSTNLWLKLFMIKCDFWMWNSWKFRTEIWKNENEKINEQLIDNFFIEFDMFLFVANVKFERFNEMIVLKIISNSNIWFRDVAKKNKRNELRNKWTNNFFTSLYANSSAETRKSKLLTNFRTWCSRI